MSYRIFFLAKFSFLLLGWKRYRIWPRAIMQNNPCTSEVNCCFSGSLGMYKVKCTAVDMTVSLKSRSLAKSVHWDLLYGEL